MTTALITIEYKILVDEAGHRFYFYAEGQPERGFGLEYGQMDVYLNYLDDLRQSGDTNMFGAAPYLTAVFDLEASAARAILLYWMQTFSTRHAKENDMQSFLLAIDESAPASLDLLVKFQQQQCATENLGNGQYRVTGFPNTVQGITDQYPEAIFKCEAASH